MNILAALLKSKFVLVLITLLSSDVTGAFTLSEEERKNPRDIILGLHPETNDRRVMKRLHDILLQIKNAPSDDDAPNDGFIYCTLVIDSITRSTEKLRFRVKLEWTGGQVKREVERLCHIPAEHQNLIINDRVVSDAQILRDFNIKSTGQVVKVFLAKKKINYRDSELTVGDVVQRRDVGDMEVDAADASPMDVGGSDSSGGDAASTRSASSGKRKNRRRKRKR